MRLAVEFAGVYRDTRSPTSAINVLRGPRETEDVPERLLDPSVAAGWKYLNLPGTTSGQPAAKQRKTNSVAGPGGPVPELCADLSICDAVRILSDGKLTKHG